MPAIAPLATFSPSVNARAWSSTPHPHLAIIATACSDKSVRIYSTANFAQQSSITGGHKRSIRSCAWKPNSVGESVLVTGSFDASAGIWRRWEENAGKGAPPQELDFTKSLAGGDGAEDDDDDDEWRFAVILDGHDSEIKSVAFAPTAPLLATCSRDKSIWIWEELEDDNFETVAVLQEHEGDVKCVAWHPEEPLLASASYDDNIRLWKEDDDDWACCTLIQGHAGTVWWVAFEPENVQDKLRAAVDMNDRQKALLVHRSKAGARLISCSDDKTIRLWQRVPKEVQETAGTRIASVWKNTNFDEEWVEESRLPVVHDSTIYALSWSRITGRVLSCGSDGKIVVYEERWTQDRDADHDTAMSGAEVQHPEKPASLTEWVVVADVENAHDVFEVNHAVWAPRADKEKRHENEEIIISTGDDGEVRAWTLDD